MMDAIISFARLSRRVSSRSRYPRSPSGGPLYSSMRIRSHFAAAAATISALDTGGIRDNVTFIPLGEDIGFGFLTSEETGDNQ